VSGVQAFYRGLGHGDLPRGFHYQSTRAGLRNIYGQVDITMPANALTEPSLRATRALLDLRRLDHARLWCGLLFGFQGLLRASEFVAGGLLLQDVKLYSWGLLIMVPFSKTSLTPVGVALVKRPDELCPVRALRSLVKLGKLKACDPIINMSYESFNKQLQAWCREAGLGAGYSSHSLRRGGATALFTAGVPEAAIMAHGRWRTLQYRKYIQFDLKQQRMATAQLLESQRTSSS
jgi:integrase